MFLNSLALAQSPALTQSDKGSDPAKTALVEELIVAIKAEQNQQQVMQTIQTGMLNQINQMVDSQLKSLGEGTQEDSEKRRRAKNEVQDYQRRLFELMTARMSWQTMKPVYVALYNDTFTTDELRPLIVFFKSPAGQVYVNKMPALMSNTMARMQQVLVAMMPDIQKLNAEFMQQMKQKYPAKN